VSKVLFGILLLLAIFITVEHGCNVMKGTEHFVSLWTGVVTTKEQILRLTERDLTYRTNFSYTRIKHNRYTVSFLHVSALPGYHYQGILMLTQAANIE